MEYGRSFNKLKGSIGGKHTYVEKGIDDEIRYYIRMPLLRVPKIIWIWYSKLTKSYIPESYT